MLFQLPGSQKSAFALPWGKSACFSYGLGIVNTRRAAHFVSQPAFFILCCGRGALEWSSQGATHTLLTPLSRINNISPEQLRILQILLIQHKAQDDTLLPRRANAYLINIQLRKTKRGGNFFATFLANIESNSFPTAHAHPSLQCGLSTSQLDSWILCCAHRSPMSNWSSQASNKLFDFNFRCE
jgi:hypothetical protein